VSGRVDLLITKDVVWRIHPPAHAGGTDNPLYPPAHAGGTDNPLYPPADAGGTDKCGLNAGRTTSPNKPCGLLIAPAVARPCSTLFSLLVTLFERSALYLCFIYSTANCDCFDQFDLVYDLKIFIGWQHNGPEAMLTASSSNVFARFRILNFFLRVICGPALFLSSNTCIVRAAPLPLSPAKLSEALFMKRCPCCDFTFADFHRVCDFDGAELIDDPERPRPNAKAPSRFWQFLKSPPFLAGSGLVFVLASALLIGYYDATNQLNSTAVNQPPQSTSADPITAAQDSTPSTDQARAEIKTPARAPVTSNSKRANQSSFTARRQTSIARISPRSSRQSARASTASSARARPGKSQAAETREAKETGNRKDPKLVAMLKTTWNVLKKPFKF
jgi:hypothetical protein